MSGTKIQRLRELDKNIRHMEFVVATMDWDQQTYMPARSSDERAEQLALLEGIAHKMQVDPEIGSLLDDLGAADSSPSGGDGLEEHDSTLVREMFRRYRRMTKLPDSLVQELAKERSLAQAAWVEARKNDSYGDFAPSLEKVLSLVKQTAECLGYDNHPYDALLDLYEPEMRTDEVTEVFAGLRDNLADLVARISSAPAVRDDFLTREFPLQEQEEFSREVLDAIGFSFDRGRLDVSAHPFTTTLGPHDVRLTTRYDKTWFVSSLFGSIHEGGHGMYEQGFGEEISGTVLGDATSLGIHESQSRSWENIVGRSREFWSHFYGRLSELFPTQLGDVSLEEFYLGINRVRPSFIRVEADEVTYNLHIILRFELEKAMITGDLAVADLPGEWNDRMKDLLGIVPASDADGVLQDVHWSAGLIGYFPTYALGNLYGAQFAAQMTQDMPGLAGGFAEGVFKPVLDWQRDNIHRHGRVYSAGQICEMATGERLNPDYFMKYLTDKYTNIYGL